MDDSRQEMTAGPPLLATKFHVPGWREDFVSRPRLVAALDWRPGSKLTLVSASAGFGKTTLLAEWLAAGELPVAWVSLDSGDNDPALFWAYLITAMQTIQPGVGENALSLLRSPQPPPIETVLTTFINEVGAIANDFVLILDDFHVIDAPAIHQAVAFLVDHMPPQMRLIIATREGPRLPLSRLRARDQLIELRAADLRFAPSEAVEFLNQMMGLDLQEADVIALETRTEGWIAGLQLAALSMRGRHDVSGFIRSFAGDDRYIVDYLIEEVLHRQPERVRSFLLQTAILDRLSGSLCDAVTDLEKSQGMLEELERGNLFVVPLDDKRRWYRYHHLFADVLRARLLAEHSDQVATLHRRASVWFEQQGSTADAIRHALAAEDFDRAADLIELAATPMRRNRQEATLLGWIRMLPEEEVIRRRPVLSSVYGGVLLSNGEIDGVEARLQVAEQWVEATADTGERSSEMIVVDEDEYRRLPGSLAVHRAGLALAQGDVDATVRHARQALEVIAEDDHLYLGAASAILGLASWTTGDLETAHRSFGDGMASLRRAGYVTDTVGGVLALADIRIAQGRLHDAMRIYQQTLQLATGQDGAVLRGAADMHVGMSELHRERNDLDAAAQHLASSTEMGEAAGFPQNPYRWRVAMARLREAQGDLDGALDLLSEAERRYVSDFYPNVRPLAAMKTRVWIAQGRLGDALDWAHAQGLSTGDDLSYLREYEHVTLARMLLAQDRADQATEFLDRLLTAADAGGRMRSAIEILVLQSLAHQQRADLPSAHASLERALALAEPEGYVRIFVDEGEPMRQLLRETGKSAYARRLLDAFGEPAQLPSAPAQASTLAEPLTAREIEILRLIAAGMRNQEIADRLFISLPTVKRHVANAYGKLGVSHRTEAVARANELNLL
jgi:LuxR family maltose regulon positive regulatory protein